VGDAGNKYTVQFVVDAVDHAPIAHPIPPIPGEVARQPLDVVVTPRV